MAKVRAKDRIRLSTGEELLLGEAFDQGFVTVDTTKAYGRNATEVTRYIARETNGDLYWEIGRMLYDSRYSKRVPTRRAHDADPIWFDIYSHGEYVTSVMGKYPKDALDTYMIESGQDPLDQEYIDDFAIVAKYR